MNEHHPEPSPREGLHHAVLSSLRDAPGVLLAGPAGIGKSHLLDRLVVQARAEGVRVLRCSPVEAELPLPFMCLIDLLEPVPDGVLAALPTGQRDALRAALLRGGDEDQDVAADGPGVHLAVLTLLRRLAAEGPLWLVLDDVQWMDRPTAQVLAFVARRAAGPRLRVLATERVPAGQAAGQLGLCPPGTAELTVPPMTREDLGPLLQRQSGAPLSAATVREISRLAQGNPLYALEILRSLPASAEAGPAGLGHAAGHAGPPHPALSGLSADGSAALLPGLFRGLLLDRLGSLPEAARETLVLASAAARPDLTLLATAGGDGATPHLEAAEKLGLVRIGPDGQVQFDHPLIRTAVYSEATGQERRSAHRRLAAAATEPVQRARHLALANPAQDEAVAATLMVAATAARRRGAPATAAELSALAVARTPADEGPARIRRRLASAGHACDAGLWDEARTQADAVLAEAADPEARVHARIVLLKAAGQALEGAGRLIAEGLAEAAGSPALESQLRCWASTRELLAGRVGQAITEAHRAAELAESAGDAAARVDALTTLAYLQRLGGGQDAEQTLARALELAEGEEIDDQTMWESLITEALFHLHANRLDAAEEAVAAALARFGDRMSVEDDLRTQVALTDIRNRAGDCAGALVSARRAAALYEDIEGSEGPVAYATAAAEATTGSLDRARELAEQGARTAERDGDRFWYLWNLTVLGRVHLLADEPVRAAAVLREVRRIEESMGIVDPGIGRWHPDLAEALVGAGALEEAGEFIAEVSATARRLDRRAVLACLERAAALRCLALGDLDRAEALLGSAIGVLRLEGVPLELARALVALADLERRRRRHAAARRAADEASQLCRTAGATAWFGRVEQIAQGSVRRAEQAAAPALTTAEHRIAVLAAGGATNREIAAVCFLSVKTVEAALSRVYRKLGVRSRTELAKTLSG